MAKVAVTKIIALAVTIGTRFQAMLPSLRKVLLARCRHWCISGLISVERTRNRQYVHPGPDSP
jgi:hypothetical protein